MAPSSVPFVVTDSGDAVDAPSGAVPVNLYGAGGGGGAVDSVNGKTGDVVLAGPDILYNPELSEDVTIYDAFAGQASAIDEAANRAVWGQVINKPAFIGAGADAASARTAIDAAATSHTQAATTVTVAAIPGLTGANVQLALADLQTRLAALETP